MICPSKLYRSTKVRFSHALKQVFPKKKKQLSIIITNLFAMLKGQYKLSHASLLLKTKKKVLIRLRKKKKNLKAIPLKHYKYWSFLFNKKKGVGSEVHLKE